MFFSTQEESSYGQQGFYHLNFNDFASAYITLFSCLHVSDFDVIAGGFTAVTDLWTRLYFLMWYIIGTLLILNILKSFFLADFMLIVDRRRHLKETEPEPERDGSHFSHGDDDPVQVRGQPTQTLHVTPFS